MIVWGRTELLKIRVESLALPSTVKNKPILRLKPIPTLNLTLLYHKTGVPQLPVVVVDTLAWTIKYGVSPLPQFGNGIEGVVNELTPKPLNVLPYVYWPGAHLSMGRQLRSTWISVAV